MKRFCLMAAFWALFAAGAVFGQLGGDTQPVAIVRLSKSQPISVKEFRDYVNWMNMSKKSAGDDTALTADERRKILDTISNQLLACQAAEQEKITVSDNEVNQALDEELKPLLAYLSQKLGRSPTDADVDAELKSQTGMPKSGFKEQIRRSLLTNKYLQVKKESVFRAVKPPTDAEVAALYNEVKNKSIFDGGFVRPDAVRIKMLWVPVTKPADKPKALERANQLARLIGGDAGKFDEAVADSRKPNSGYMGGDGPYVYKNEQMRAAMGIDFYDTVFRLKQGEVSKLLERDDGYYIVKVSETLRQKALGLDDVYRLEDPRYTVKQYIQMAESQKRQLEAYEKASLELVDELNKRGSVQIMDKTYNSIVW